MAQSFQFTADFQNLILACLIKHPDRFFKFCSVLKPSYFEGVPATVVSRCAIDYFKEHSRFPRWEMLAQLAVDEFKRIGDTDTDAMLDYVHKLRRIKVDDVDEVQNRVVGFARERSTINAIKKCIDLLKKGEKPSAGFVKVMEDAISVGANFDDLGYLLHRDFDDVIDKLTAPNYGTHTGYTKYDEIWKTGWGPGWLVVPLAPPKRYKSMFCTNLAMHMVGPMIGTDVIYYSCELSQELSLYRCLSNMTGKDYDYMLGRSSKFKRRVREEVQKQIAGNLLIKGFPAKSVTISDIKIHAKRVIQQTNIRPKVIFIDYAETIAPSDTKMSEHQQQASVYTEARAMGSELGCTIVMPDRCNKETTDFEVPNMTSFQGAFQKAGIVDVAIGLCATDAEYSQNILRTFIFLNRHGQAYQQFKGLVDPTVAQIDIGEQIEFDPEKSKKIANQFKRKRRSMAPGELIEDEAA